VSVVLRALSPGGAVASKVVRITVVPRPAAAADFYADAGRHSAAVAWTEPAQPDSLATSYELRYLVNSTINESNFSTGTLVSQFEVPGPEGTPHCVEIPDLTSCKNLSIALRTWRHSFPSTISNVAAASTACSGSFEVRCGDFGLWGGGGSGGSLRLDSNRTAWTAGSPASASSPDQAATENTLLGGVPGSYGTDLMRLPSALEPRNGEYAVRLWRTVGSLLDLGQVELLAVDRGENEEAFSSSESVLLGTSAAVSLIRDSRGKIAIDPEGHLPDGGVELGRDDALSIDIGEAAGSPVLLVGCVAPAAEVVRDSVGIAVQVPTETGEWQTIGLLHPRHEPDRFAIELQGSRLARLLALGRYKVVSIERLEDANRSTPVALPMTRATHSTAGDVAAALRSEDLQTVSLRPGEAVQLAFEASPVASGRIRKFFLRAVGGTESGRTITTASSSTTPVAAGSLVNALGAARPNPTSDRVLISYTLQARSQARLSIYDVAGRHVRTLVSENQSSGPHEVEWDGRTEEGTISGPGVYFYRLELAGWRGEKKLVVLNRR
jgi:hypothetical protein